MISAARSLLLAVILLSVVVFCCVPASAQVAVATGTPQFGSFGGGPDVINLGNLNMHYTIPVLHKRGRGTDFIRDIIYDSSFWTPVTSNGTQSWAVPGGFGWSLGPNGQSYITYSVTYTTSPCGYQGQSSYQEWIYSNFTYYDQFGVSTYFGGGVDYFNSPGGGTCPPNGPQPPTVQPVSAGGYALYASPGAGSVSGYVADKNGTRLYSTFTSNPPAQQTPFMSIDRNGNEITSANGVYTDTLNTTALTVAGTAPSNTTFTYTPPSGPNVAYTVSYKSYTVRTNFGCTGINDYNTSRSLQSNLVDRITLPDGSYYQLAYEITYSDTHTPHDVTGRIASITLPTGGTISYVYATDQSGVNNISCADGTATKLTRFTPDTGSTKSWTYARTQVGGNHWQTTVTDPASNQTTIDFQKDAGTSGSNFYETQRAIQQGSATLETVMTCYNNNTTSCTTTSVTFPITQQTITTQLGTSGPQTLASLTYNASGLMTEEDDYDYGSGGGPLIKKTLVTYATLSNNINALAQRVTVCSGSGTASACNGTGTVVSQTTYTYDQTTPAGTSEPQHVAVSGSRGNLTSVAYPTGTSSSSSNTYFDTGMPQTSTDSNSAVTTYSYTGSSCGNAFPTSVSITQPLSMSRSFAWNCTGGVMTQLTDENSQPTTTAYTDPYFWRPAEQDYPDGGQIRWTYTAPWQSSTTQKMNSTQSIATTTYLDGLGRFIYSQLTSDPLGTTTNQLTYYDSLGRVSSVYNPTRCPSPSTNCGESTWGYTQYSYDALNRVTSIRSQDGSTATTSYVNNTETATDQAGKARTLQTDGLGRVTNVWEDPAGLNLQTVYTYDALDDLIGVVQNGSRNRSFAYDAMSRLRCEANPEISIATCPNPDNGTYTAGTIRYAYDGNGNLTSRTAPAPNQTLSATVTTSYTYDLLHRLTRKTYSDGTPTANFYYDAAPSVWNGNEQNTVGRLVEATTPNTATELSYDPLGRIIGKYVCVPANCTIGANGQTGTGGWYYTYTYNFVGGMTQFEDGVYTYPQYFNQTFDGAGRVYQLVSTAGDAQHPTTLFTPDATNGYWPTGALREAKLGNGLTLSNVYDQRFQPCRMNVNSTSTLLSACTGGAPSGNVLDLTAGFNLGASDNGNVASWSATGNQVFSRTYTYDSLNRLKTMADSATAQPCKGLSWTYDAWGNRTNQTMTAGTCGQFQATADAQNRVHDISNFYQYDAAGNMTHDASHSYSYDAENRMASVDSGSAAAYVYDAFGRRAKKTVGSSAYEYVYDLDGNVGWENLNGALNRAYVRSNGLLLAEYFQGSTYFIHQDHLGSTRLLTGYPSPTTPECDDYYPYGEANVNVNTCLAATDTTYKFTGDERDSETNLDHTQLRQNSSALGRWMTPDPAGLSAVDPTAPQSWNRYAYVLNNPVATVDALGLGPCPPQYASYCNMANHSYGVGYLWDWSRAWSEWDEFSILTLGPTTDVASTINGVIVSEQVTSFPDNLLLLDFIGAGAGGNTGSSYIINGEGQLCTPSVFNPSCKPPSCPALFVHAALEADLGLPPDVDQAAKTAAAAAATNRIVTRGLVKPLASSYVRRAVLFGDLAADFVSLGPILYQELVGFTAEVKAWRAGACTTIWSNP
jgi:RHS repeat-associated protein